MGLGVTLQITLNVRQQGSTIARQFSPHVSVPDNIGAIGMDLDISDVIRVRLPSLHFLRCVVIVNTEMHVVRARNNPLLTNYKFRASDRHFAHFEGFHQGLQAATTQP